MIDRTSDVHAELVQLARALVVGGRDVAGGPSFAQHSLLAYIARNPGCRATDVSEEFGLNRSTVSRQLRGCIESGWVLAEPGSLRTGYPLRLTTHGTDVLAAADVRRLDEVRARLHGWSLDEIAQFANTLHRFRIAPAVVDRTDDTPRLGDDAHA